MESENNIDIVSLDDDEVYIIESDRFYRTFTLENVDTARTKKSYLKIRNNKGEHYINWTCQQVCSLLNSFPTWDLQIKSNGQNISKLRLIDPENSKIFLHFKLYPNFSMNAKASMIFLITNCENAKEIVQVEKDETVRSLKKPKSIFLHFFRYSIDLSNISNFAIFNCKNLIFYPPELFSEPFNHFCHYSCFRKQLPNTTDNSFSLIFIKTWIKHPEREENTNFESLIEKCEGKLILYVTNDHKQLKKYPRIEHEGQILRIIGGLYISKDAKLIIEKNKSIISGFLLDATFRAIPTFVTAIIMASIYNVGVPLAFLFSVTESKTIYQRIFDGFKNKLSINLSDFIFESDQGRSLLSFFDENKIKNIICIRHLLSSLRNVPFGFQISTIIKSRSQLDLDTSMCHFSTEFENFLIQYNEQNSTEKEILEKSKNKYNEMKDVLNQSLQKVGLHFTDQIIIQNEERWNQVSLFARIPLAMPSTTNSLESSHGHINENVPRRNNFFNAIYKLIKWSNHKIFNFQELLTKNYNYIQIKTKKDCYQKVQMICKENASIINQH